MNPPPAPSVLPDGGFLSQPWEGRAALLTSRRLKSSVAVIRAQGGIDASNADTLTEYTLGHLMRCRGLILDLRDLDFFGTEGFFALHRVSVCCARAAIGWAVVPGDPPSPSPTAQREPQGPRTIFQMRTHGVLGLRRYTTGTNSGP